MTDEARERKRMRDRERYHRMKQDPEWNARREVRLARCRKYMVDHREERLAYVRAWKKANPDKMAAQRRRYRDRVKAAPERFARAQAVKKKYLNYGGGRELRALWAFARWRKLCETYQTSNVAYAKYRRKNRERWARKAGIRYKPKPAMRIPDWATMGQDIFDRRSAYLANNHTKDARLGNDNFAMHLAIDSTI